MVVLAVVFPQLLEVMENLVVHIDIMQAVEVGEVIHPIQPLVLEDQVV